MNLFDRVLNLVDRFVSNVGRSIENIAKDPLPTIASVALQQVGVPAWVTQTAIGAVRGASMEDMVLNLAKGYAASQVGTYVGEQFYPSQGVDVTGGLETAVPYELNQELFKSILVQSSTQAAKAALDGKSFDQILQSATTGAITGAVSEGIRTQLGLNPNELDGKILTGAVSSATRALLGGRSVEDAVANSIAQTALGSTVGNLTSGIKSALKSYETASDNYASLQKEAQELYDQELKYVMPRIQEGYNQINAQIAQANQYKTDLDSDVPAFNQLLAISQAPKSGESEQNFYNVLQTAFGFDLKTDPNTGKDYAFIARPDGSEYKVAYQDQTHADFLDGLYRDLNYKINDINNLPNFIDQLESKISYMESGIADELQTFNLLQDQLKNYDDQIVDIEELLNISTQQLNDVLPDYSNLLQEEVNKYSKNIADEAVNVLKAADQKAAVEQAQYDKQVQADIQRNEIKNIFESTGYTPTAAEIDRFLAEPDLEDREAEIRQYAGSRKLEEDPYYQNYLKEQAAKWEALTRAQPEVVSTPEPVTPQEVPEDRKVELAKGLTEPENEYERQVVEALRKQTPELQNWWPKEVWDILWNNAKMMVDSNLEYEKYRGQFGDYYSEVEGGPPISFTPDTSDVAEPYPTEEPVIKQEPVYPDFTTPPLDTTPPAEPELPVIKPGEREPIAAVEDAESPGITFTPDPSLPEIIFGEQPSQPEDLGYQPEPPVVEPEPAGPSGGVWGDEPEYFTDDEGNTLIVNPDGSIQLLGPDGEDMMPSTGDYDLGDILGPEHPVEELQPEAFPEEEEDPTTGLPGIKLPPGTIPGGVKPPPTPPKKPVTPPAEKPGTQPIFPPGVPPLSPTGGAPNLTGAAPSLLSLLQGLQSQNIYQQLLQPRFETFYMNIPGYEGFDINEMFPSVYEEE